MTFRRRGLLKVLAGGIGLVAGAGTATAAQRQGPKILRLNARDFYRYWRAIRAGRTPRKVALDVIGIRVDAFDYAKVTISIDPQSKAPGPTIAIPIASIKGGRGPRLRLILTPEKVVPEPDTKAVIEVVFYDEAGTVAAAVSGLGSMKSQ